MGMKVIYSCVMVLLFATMPVFAQGQPLSADDIVAKMQSQLNLTQDQVAAITPIIEKYSSKRQELQQNAEDGTLERSDMRTQMKQLRVDEKQELSQILSADQMIQWKQMQKQMHAHSAASSNHDSNNPPPQN